MLPIVCFIWEPVVFFFPFIAAVLAIKLRKEKFTKLFGKIAVSFIPSLIAFFLTATVILSPENFVIMENALEKNFGEECYSSCGLFVYKSSIASQFAFTTKLYRPEVFVRYFLIILIGFGPLFLLTFYTNFKTKVIFFQSFNNLLYPFLIILSPVIVMFAAMVDWGRVVNISYTFSALFYFYLLKNNLIKIDLKKIEKKISFISGKKIMLIICFIIYAFGWNPKTLITGDVASFPGYRIPYKSFKTFYSLK